MYGVHAGHRNPVRQHDGFPPKDTCSLRPVPPMSVAEFRISDEQRALVIAQAERHGISFSEYVRRSINFTLGWAAALDAVNAGAHPSSLTDIEHVTRMLATISAEPA